MEKSVLTAISRLEDERRLGTGDHVSIANDLALMTKAMRLVVVQATAMSWLAVGTGHIECSPDLIIVRQG
jgi:hypothetical protein